MKFDIVICDQEFVISLVDKGFDLIFIIASIREAGWMAALDMGADSVVFSEFSESMILSQINALARRGSRSAKKMLRFFPHLNMTIDSEDGSVEINNQKIDVTHTELRILRTLALANGNVVPRSQMKKMLRAHTRSLDVHCCSLRSKIKDCGVILESARGVGYRLFAKKTTVKSWAGSSS